MTSVGGTGPLPRRPDLDARLLKNFLVGRVLPDHQAFDDAEEALAFVFDSPTGMGRFRAWIGQCGVATGLGGLAPGNTGAPCGHLTRQFAFGPAPDVRVCKQLIDVRRRVVDHLPEDHRPRRREWAPRPVEMQRARVPVPDGPFLCTGLIDLFQWKGDFDQLLAHHWPVLWSGDWVIGQKGTRRVPM